MAIAISMVMLQEDEEPSTSDFRNELSSNWPELEISNSISKDGNTLSFEIGASNIILGKMSAPLPWSDLEGPCATSILWPKATDEVKLHKIHWIVTVSGQLSPLEFSKLLTQVTAAFMAACPSAIGVYWGNATLVIPKNIFIDFAKEVLPQGPPLHIWIDFRVGKDSEKSSSGFTTGMTALGHMEIEAQGAPEPPSDLRGRLLSLTEYLIDKGPVIKDGDTIGDEVGERIRVIYSKSSFGHEGKVMRLKYEKPSSKNSWWKLW